MGGCNDGGRCVVMGGSNVDPPRRCNVRGYNVDPPKVHTSVTNQNQGHSLGVGKFLQRHLPPLSPECKFP